MNFDFSTCDLSRVIQDNVQFTVNLLAFIVQRGRNAAHIMKISTTCAMNPHEIMQIMRYNVVLRLGNPTDKLRKKE